jgi:hypothetical protein
MRYFEFVFVELDLSQVSDGFKLVSVELEIATQLINLME